MKFNLLVLMFIAFSAFVLASGEEASDVIVDQGEDDDSKPGLGVPVKRGVHPNAAAILRDQRQFCGGSLISENFILTAGNCVSFLNGNDIPKLRVYLNTVALKTYNPGAIISKVVSFKVHEKYNKKTNENDIALIKLGEKVTTLYPLTLPDPGSNDTYVGQNATILRWGNRKSNEGTTQRVLLTADVQVISNNDCSDSYNGTDIFDSSLCASSLAKNEGNCQDESSGGAMIVGGRQIGITSWGKGCMDSKYPGVYTRVNKYLNWISSTMASM